MYIVIAILVSLATAFLELSRTVSRPDVFVSFGAIIPLVLLMPRLARHGNKWSGFNLSSAFVRRFELIGLVIVLLNAPASLWWHQIGIQYDRFLHFAAGGLVAYAIVLSVSLVAVYSRGVLHASGVLAASALLLCVGVFAWEGFQWSIDAVLGWHTFGDVIQPIFADVAEDIMFGLLGGGLAISIVARTFQKNVSVLIHTDKE